MRILYVEDATFLAEAVKYNLEKQGILVDLVNNGEDGLENALSDIYDCVVLDIMLPKLSGTDILKRMREKKVQTPVIMLSALSEVETKISHLDHGADDYLAKPFSTAELIARVRAMLRRKDNYVPDLLSFNDVVLNRSTYEFVYNNKTQTLSGKEFQIAEMMMQQPNSIITTEQFITHIWGWNTNVDTSVVWVHISNLRKKIDAINAPIEIRFIRNAGYVFEDKQ